MKLLIIEDEQALQDNIADYFHRRNHQCILAATVKEAIRQLHFGAFDCILLDISLPGGSGLELLQDIRGQRRKEGIIILSARDSTDDKVQGLDLGADDYVTKPFHLSELHARVNSVVRRKQFNASTILLFNELKVDVDERRFYVHEKPVALSRKENNLLLLLVSNNGRIVSKTAIADHLYGNETSYFSNLDVVYSHMKNLKKKLSEAGCADYIRTIHGLGYKFEHDETAA
ncbi:MAG TPA: response regulator transcription factor [Puia sp.]|nr:response regulator transcription factor [Puia sp.]